MQSNPNRISSNPLLIEDTRDGDQFTVLKRTPHGRIFQCCNKVTDNGKHGRYMVPKKRWEKSRRDHVRG